MSERYQNVKMLTFSEQILGCPIEINSGTILFDMFENRCLLQLKFRNVSGYVISSAFISIACFDDAGDAVSNGAMEYAAYMNVESMDKAFFGESTVVPLKSTIVRRVKVTIDKVVMASGEVWYGEGSQSYNPQPQYRIEEEIKQQLIREAGANYNPMHELVPLQLDTVWQCACGRANVNQAKTCCRCGVQKDWVFEQLNKERLAQNLVVYHEWLRGEADRQRMKIEAQAEQDRIAKELRKKKGTKIMIWSASSVAVVVAFVIVLNTVIMPFVRYDQANNLLTQKQYTQAQSAFANLKNYKDSPTKVQECEYALAESYIANKQYAQAIDIFKTLPNYKDSQAQWAKSNYLMEAMLSTGWYNTIGLKKDGTVVATKFLGDAKDNHGQCKVSGWTDMATVSAGSDHTVGLKKNGTVVAVGDNTYKQCDVSAWTDVVAVSAGGWHTVALRKDGTVEATGDDGCGQCDCTGWTDIVAISAGELYTAGLKKDGTVVCTNFTGDAQYYYGQCNVSDWTDIVAISAGKTHTVGLKKDGTVVATKLTGNAKFSFGQCNVSGWKDIVAISAGGWHTVGLKKDGTVVAVGDNESGRCNVSSWKDIVAVSAGGWQTVGLKKDGTVVATGFGGNGQCDVTAWSGIK